MRIARGVVGGQLTNLMDALGRQVLGRVARELLARERESNWVLGKGPVGEDRRSGVGSSLGTFFA